MSKTRQLNSFTLQMLHEWLARAEGQTDFGIAEFARLLGGGQGLVRIVLEQLDPDNVAPRPSKDSPVEAQAVQP